MFNGGSVIKWAKYDIDDIKAIIAADQSKDGPYVQSLAIEDSDWKNLVYELIERVDDLLDYKLG